MAEPMVLAYEERGSGPVLVCIHGFPLDRTMWINQLAGLAKVRRVVAVDLRGHGLSEDPAPAGYSMDLFADDVAATLDEIGEDSADVMALSMGGYVAFTLWRRHPQRVRSLILCCTKAEPDTDEGKKGRDDSAALVREQGMEALVDRLVKVMYAEGTPADVIEAGRRSMLATPPEVAIADLMAMKDREDSVPTLGTITVPALWIAGEADKIMPLDGAKAAAAGIPGSSFLSVAGGGHMTPVEKPAETNEALVNFLKRP